MFYFTNLPIVMSDLTFSVFRRIFQAVLTSTSFATNWTGLLDFFLYIKVPNSQNIVIINISSNINSPRSRNNELRYYYKTTCFRKIHYHEKMTKSRRNSRTQNCNIKSAWFVQYRKFPVKHIFRQEIYKNKEISNALTKMEKVQTKMCLDFCC